MLVLSKAAHDNSDVRETAKMKVSPCGIRMTWKRLSRIDARLSLVLSPGKTEACPAVFLQAVAIKAASRQAFRPCTLATSTAASFVA